MRDLAIRKELIGSVDEQSLRMTEALQKIGFGVLTRIDLDQKFQEKLGKSIPRTVVLGACNPGLAFGAYQQSTDTALLIPCNVVVRETGPQRVAIEVLRPTLMLELLQGVSNDSQIFESEKALERLIEAL